MSRSHASSRTEPPRVCLISLGCVKNQVDSEHFLGRLTEGGAVICSEPDDADVIVVNTCGFILPAKQESVDTILEMAQHKEHGRCRRLVVAGCLVARHEDELRQELPEVDAFVGVGDTDALARACGLQPGVGPAPRLRFGLHHVGYLRISDGCDNRCAYCTIPLIRGPLRSRSVADVLSEADDLIADDAREMVVIGQDTTSYGLDRGRAELPSLLTRIADRVGDRWLRLMYTHPAHFTRELISAFADAPQLCPYVDLPLQHLADPVLKRMGRRVTQRQVLDLIDDLRQRVPDIAIRTTFIVGFPGETDRDFAEMMRRVEHTRFDHLGAFAYSREEGTPAAGMPNQVDEDTAQARLDALMDIQYGIVSSRHSQRLGQTVTVLIDGPSDDGRSIGRTRGQAPDVDSVVLISGCCAEPGAVGYVRITGAEDYDLVGQWCSTSPSVR